VLQKEALADDLPLNGAQNLFPVLANQVGEGQAAMGLGSSASAGKR